MRLKRPFLVSRMEHINLCMNVASEFTMDHGFRLKKELPKTPKNLENKTRSADKSKTAIDKALDQSLYIVELNPTEQWKRIERNHVDAPTELTSP